MILAHVTLVGAVALTLFLVTENIIERKHCADIEVARLDEGKCVVDKPDAVFKREGRILLGSFFGDLDEAFRRIQDSICDNP